MVSYNLLTESWIPVRGKDGKISEKGILETLEYAHKLEEICDPAPPVQFGIYRLLIAFLMDAYQLQSLEDLGNLIEKGKFDKEVLEKYASQWHDRFDLFDEKHPFMQVPRDDLKKAKEPISRLMQHIPAGTNVSHFHHGNWENNAYSFAQCARGLVTVPPFMTAGGAGLSPSINGNPPWYVLVKGDDLFQTLALNICKIPLLIKTQDSNPPVWRDDNFLGKDNHKSFSIVEGLTWRPRSIHMVPESGGLCTYTGKENTGLVRYMYFASGLKAPEPGLWSDPQVAYILGKDGMRTVKPEENKEMWRDIGPLMLLQEEDYTTIDGKRYQRPAIVKQYTELANRGIVSKNRPLTIEVYGIRTDGKMKFYEWYFERLTLPWGLLYRKSAGKQIQEAMDYSSKTVEVIKKALKDVYSEGAGNLIIRAQSSFWRSLKSQFKDQFLERLAEEDDTDPDAPAKLLTDWKKVLEQEGYKSLSTVIEHLDANGNELRHQVEARGKYWMYIKSELYPEQKKKKQKKKEVISA